MKSDKGSNKIGYALDWHNDDYFGLCLTDQVKYFGKLATKYKKPLPTETEKNTANSKPFRVKKMSGAMSLA